MELDSDMQAFSFGVRHRRSLEPSAVLRQLGEYHFSKTREFCDSQKRFGVVVDDHDQLLTLEIASKQELPEADDGCDEDLRHLQTSGRSDLPSSPSSPLCIKKTNTRTMHFGNTGAGAVRLPKTRKYEAAPANATVTQHRVQFVAENCGHVADETREKVPQALNLDVCDALGISWKCVEEVTLSPDGRLVTFGVRHSPKMSRADVRSALIAHDFPYTWKVYEPDTLVEFESGVERTTAEQKSQATPKATSTSSIYFSPSSVPPFVRVAEPQNFVKDSFTISNTASLEVLHTAIGDGTVVTKHRVKFNGDNWGAVLEKKRAAFDEAFDADVCDALDLPRGSVEGITLGSDGLSIDFGVRHPASLHKDEVDHFLSTSEFPAMWNLYEPKKKVLSSIVMGDTEERETTSFSTSLPQRASPVSAKEFPSCLHPAPGVASSSVPMDRADGASGSGNVCHLYRVGFVGGFWSGIVDKRFTAAVDCFMRDAAVGEGLVPRSVERVVSLDSGNVVFSVWMEHAAALSQSEVCTAMDNAPFPSMWKLYDDLINEGVVGRTTTLHRVGLVGSEWAHVANVDLVKEVFIQDVAEALRLSPEDINVNEYTVNDKLVIGFYVSHSHTLTEVDIDDMLANAPLSRVWGLCPVPGTNSWKAAHCKGSARSNSGSFPHTEPLRGGRFRDLSPIPLSGGIPAETPHDRRSNSQYRRSLGPLQGVVSPPMRRYDGHNQHSGRFYQANKRSPGQFSPPNQPVVNTKGVHAMRMSPQSGRFKAGSARGGGSLIAGSDPVRASLPRVDLLKVGELLALMRRRQLEEGSTRLPPLTGRAQPYPSCAPSTVKRYVGSK
ncbi:Flagellar Member 8 [Trypanosoma equiperdum]|nr:Flagellar Member 8 [Trypanosoma equiperdum]